MAFFRTLRMVFWLSAVPALIAVSGAGPRFMPGRPADGDRLAAAAPTPRLQQSSYSDQEPKLLAEKIEPKCAKRSRNN